MDRNYGKVTQVIGSTLDAQFRRGSFPRSTTPCEVEVEPPCSARRVRETLWCEVAQHLGGGRVRAVALGSTDGLQRGAEIVDTGQHPDLGAGR